MTATTNLSPDAGAREAGDGAAAALLAPLRASSLDRPDLDLDAVDAELPAQRHPFPVIVLALCLVGLLAAAWLRSALQTVPPPPAPEVMVTAELQLVVMSPLPTGIFEVVVTNRDTKPVRLSSVTASGSGIRRSVSTTFGDELDPGDVRRVQVRVPLNCGQLVDDVGPPDLRVGVAGPSGLVTSVAAIPTGPLTTAGLCPTAVDQLPGGWNAPVVLRGFTSTAQTATASFAGLPDGSTSVLYVRADDWSLPLVSDATVSKDGVAAVTVQRPELDCAALPEHSSLTAGLQIMVNGPVAGPQLVYLPVGPELSSWLLAAWNAACPGSPGPQSTPSPEATT